MTPASSLTRGDLERLIAEHQALVHLANELEFQAYRLGELTPPPPDRVGECQQAAGRLIGLLRQFLFRQDQMVFPLLERESGDE